MNRFFPFTVWRAAAGPDGAGWRDGAVALQSGHGDLRRHAQHQVVPRLVSHLRLQRDVEHRPRRRRLHR
ncbi:hypothetical protein R5R35_013392 [Gryllus longicercus]|uniref:Uncharacterized protein n=1 Tax=Gryllus longicercus TaxID=2509291 RepID=A0AAN9VYK3_9ORTH